MDEDRVVEGDSLKPIKMITETLNARENIMFDDALTRENVW